MIDEISTVVIKALVGVISLFLYIYLVTAVYPWLTMRLVCVRRPWRIRGVRRVTFPDGRGVVYEPDVRVRRYIPQYAILLRDGHKFLQCKLDPRVAYLRYDVVSLNRYGRMLDIVEVRETPIKRGQTQPVSLPTETAYAYLIPRRVDDMYTSREQVARYSFVGFGICAGLTVLTTLVVAALLYNGVVPVLTSLLPEVAPPARGMFLLIACLMGLLTAGWIFLMYFLRSRRVVNR